MRLEQERSCHTLFFVGTELDLFNNLVGYCATLLQKWVSPEAEPL
jgi:hypothetical protein